MKALYTLTRKEVQAYFNSPVGWLFVMVFLVACTSLFFLWGAFFAMDRADLRSFFALMPMVLALILPALTMRLWAEEKKQGTYEFLLTMPYSEAQLVLGKHCAAMLVVLFALALSLPVPLFVSFFGSLDVGKLLAEYLGVLLLASATAAIGQLVSALSRNQMSAFIVSVAILLGLNLVGQLPGLFNLPLVLSRLLSWLSLSHHFVAFSRGVLDSRDLAYFALLSIAPLYLTTRSIAMGRWS